MAGLQLQRVRRRAIDVEFTGDVRSTPQGCAVGTGIYILGTAGTMAAQIVENISSDNTSIGSTSGGGLGLFGSGAVLVERNVIANNVTRA